jgi:TRAP-type C4-dicarboxylate transport system permease small subunit
MRTNRIREFFSCIDKVADILEKTAKYSCIVLGGSMAVVVISGVVARYVMKNPMVWTEEIARALMIWTAFIGISIAARHRSHLGVTLLVVRLPIILQRLVKLFTDALSMGFLYVLTVYGFQMVETGKVQIETATGITMNYFFICVPLCGLLTMIQLGVVILVDLSRWGTSISPYHNGDSTQVLINPNT